MNSKVRVYLDNCAYNRPYDDQTQLSVAMESQSKLQIQSEIKGGKIELVSSYILDYELSRNPFEMRKAPIQRFLKDAVKYYIGSERDAEIAPLADEIMKTGVKEKDAYHIAAAIYAHCDYFISTDIRLLKYKTDKIKLVTPIEFITEREVEE
ncbi:MAG: hypothetical protein K6A74_06175 [Lachnospiraceae bacterium]|nr:hypothetical protein [Lachnospiraceae bacterium]